MPQFIPKRLSHLLLIALSCTVIIAFGQLPTISDAASNNDGLPDFSNQPPPDLSQLPALIAEAQQNGTAKVLVSFRTTTPTKIGKGAEAKAQQSVLQKTRDAFLKFLNGHNVKVKAGTDWVFPAIALSADSTALQQLAQSPLISGISSDHELKLADAPGDALIGIPATWNLGYTGLNQTVAILDTGVQEDHPFFGNRVLGEACFSTNDITHTSFCPNGQSSQFGAGAGAPCPSSIGGCEHGTHVAGIAAGNGLSLSGVNYAGVAINANILAVQIFSRVSYGSGYSLTALDSDIISGLNWVASQASSFNIAAVNMSLGNGIIYNGNCDSQNMALKSAIDTLRTNNIATVIAAGNDSATNGISYPGCISSAISVGAINNADAIQSFSNSGLSGTQSLPSLLAPGAGVYSSLPGSTYGALSGTSMATPYVTGLIAVLKSEKPTATVDQLLGVLQNTGRLLTDARNNAVVSRVQADAAASAFVPKHKTIGVFRNNIFYLRNSNTTGYGDESIPFGYGSNNYPVAGDWLGDGVDRIGVYDQSKGQFELCTAGDSTGCAYTKNFIQFTLGLAGDQPMAGRWIVRDTYTNSGSGPTISATPHDGVGVFRPSNGLIYLKTDFTSGYADYTMVLGIPGDVGLVGDWNGDGLGTPGVYRPATSVFFLTNSVCNCSVYGDLQFTYGLPYNGPVAGNWPGSPTSQNVGIGLYRPSDGYFYLRNTLTSGYADTAFYYGLANDMPVAGRWLGSLLPASTNISSAPSSSILVPSTVVGSSGPPTPTPQGSHD